MAKYERYHGLVLRELAKIPGGVHVQTYDVHGIINSFIVNSCTGLYIKHSTKRLSPWLFTFTRDNLIEIDLLKESNQSVHIFLVCGFDGIISLTIEEFEQLTHLRKSDNSLSVHVKRRKRHMYAVGGRNKLERQKSKGVSIELIQDISK